MNKHFVIFTALLFVLSSLPLVTAVTVNTTEIDPDIFSPDGNGIRDTTTITVTSDPDQTLYLNIFWNQTELVRSDLVMTENPSGTYKAIWDGKDDNGSYVKNEGTYTIRITDVFGSGGGITIGTVTVDLTPPSTPSISISSGAEYTTSRDVILSITAADAYQMKVSNYANFSGAVWENIIDTKSWTLTSGDGTKTVYLRVRDIAGNTRDSSDSIILDTTEPSCSLSINNNALYTNTISVNLSITASDANGVKYMRFKNDTSNWTEWESFVTSKSWNLTNIEGERTVYVMVKDAAGNTKTASDKITLDTTPPSDLSIYINNGSSYTNSQQVTLTLSAAGGPTKIYLSNDKINWQEYDYTTSITWNLTTGDGLKTVWYKAADAAGNNATAISATITLDTTAPSPVLLNTPADGATVTTQTPQFTWSDPNSDTKNYYIEIIQSGTTIQSSYVNTTSYTAEALAPGSYGWKVIVYDRANNSATTTQRSFTISVTGLAIPTPTYPPNGAYFNNTNVNPELRWSQVTNATAYDIQYGTSQNNLSNLASVTNPYYEITSPLSHGTTIYWRVRARNTTTVTNYSSVRSFTIDTQPPTGLSIVINNGESYTSSRTVTLSLSATGATGMMISNNPDFTGASWEAYTTSKTWEIKSGDGVKTVYFKVRDSAIGEYGAAAGAYANIAPPVSDTIILDTTPPVITDPVPADNGTTTVTTNLYISANLSDLAGVDTNSVRMTIDGTEVSATVTPSKVSYIMPTVSTGKHNVSVRAADILGHVAYLNWSFTVTTGEEEEQPSNGEDEGGEEEGEEQPPSEGGEETVDNPPVISTVSHSPTTITSNDTITITAVVTDDNAITSVDLYWNDGTLHSKAMTLQTGNTYSATIGPFTAGTTVTYYIQAVDNAPQATTSDTYSFTVQNATQPSPAQPEEEKTEKPEVKPAIVNLTIDTITAGETKNISLKEYGLPIEEIKITATNNVTNVKIKVEKLTQKPANITKPPSEKIYIYLNIEENINESNITSFIIKFKVEKTWITNNNIDKNMILLMRYHNGSWQELPTTLVKEDETNIYYEATMTGFSIFAIAVKEKISPFSWIIYIAITAITLAIIAIIIILYKKKAF
ncbi:MAG: PGF-pre-PGF domain-containing protein [Thermoplasmata archaeon]|nr:PGF-pre-PGF domain-containing protein [Thermoplasmata archaeon]